jgi:hypothetical protein
MRRGKVFYKDHLAGIITETNDGEYINGKGIKI